MSASKPQSLWTTQRHYLSSERIKKKEQGNRINLLQRIKMGVAIPTQPSNHGPSSN